MRGGLARHSVKGPRPRGRTAVAYAGCDAAAAEVSLLPRGPIAKLTSRASVAEADTSRPRLEVPSAPRSREGDMEMLAVEAAPVNLRSDNVAGIAPEIPAAIEAANAGTALSPAPTRSPRVSRTSSPSCSRPAVACSRWRPGLRPTPRAGADRAVRRSLLHRCRSCTTASAGQEFYTGGAKIVPLAHEYGRLRLESLRAALERAGIGTPGGSSQPRSTTQATERVHRTAGRARRAHRRRLRIRHACTWTAPASPMLSRRSAAARRTSPGGVASTCCRSGRPRTAPWALKWSWCSPRSWPTCPAPGAARRSGVFQDAFHLGTYRSLRGGRLAAAPCWPRPMPGAALRERHRRPARRPFAASGRDQRDLCRDAASG